MKWGRKKKGDRRNPRARDVLRDMDPCPKQYYDANGRLRPCTQDAGHKGVCF